jgi:hypothetical protein
MRSKLKIPAAKALARDNCLRELRFRIRIIDSEVYLSISIDGRGTIDCASKGVACYFRCPVNPHLFWRGTGDTIVRTWIETDEF